MHKSNELFLCIVTENFNIYSGYSPGAPTLWSLNRTGIGVNGNWLSTCIPRTRKFNLTSSNKQMLCRYLHNYSK